MADVHSLRRTSPKGGSFIGTCTKCGLENIPLSQMHQSCANPANLSQDDALMLAIRDGDEPANPSPAVPLRAGLNDLSEIKP